MLRTGVSSPVAGGAPAALGEPLGERFDDPVGRVFTAPRPGRVGTPPREACQARTESSPPTRGFSGLWFWWGIHSGATSKITLGPTDEAPVRESLDRSQSATSRRLKITRA